MLIYNFILFYKEGLNSSNKLLTEIKINFKLKNYNTICSG